MMWWGRQNEERQRAAHRGTNGMTTVRRVALLRAALGFVTLEPSEPELRLL